MIVIVYYRDGRLDKFTNVHSITQEPNYTWLRERDGTVIGHLVTAGFVKLEVL